jgi:hypothetical protein
MPDLGAVTAITYALCAVAVAALVVALIAARRRQ